MRFQPVLGRAVIGAIAAFLLLGGLYLISSKNSSSKQDRLLGAVSLVSGVSVLSWRYVASASQDNQ
ncbi:MAG: hypothetical protein D6742_10760 [Cyanobacteria bacterium J069]|nr:MAG: hypothetical protein D6742_10760 [Cyanobacteria bacterium J069]